MNVARAISWLLRRFAADVVLLVIIGIAVSALVVANRDNQALGSALRNRALDAYPRMGDYLPDVPAVRLGAEERSVLVLSDVHLPAILYFLAPDCQYCVSELSDLPDFAKIAARHGYTFAAVSTAWPRQTRHMFPSVLSFPIFAEAGGGLSRSYRVEATPLFVSVDRQRRVDVSHAGVLSVSDFERALFP